MEMVWEKRKEVFKTFGVLFFLSLLIFFLEKRGRLVFFHHFLKPPILKIEKKLYNFKTQWLRWQRNWKTEAEKEREILRLQARVLQLLANQNQLAACLEENEAMRRLLGAPLPPQWQFLPARVIGVGQRMHLDQGERAGVKKGMWVVSREILVGRVIEVGERDSLVKLVTDPDSKLAVKVRQPGKKGIQARGLLVGQSKDQLVLDEVWLNEDIRRGDWVVENETNLLVGRIEEVWKEKGGVYQKAKVTPLLDYQRLEVVFLVFQ